MYRESIVIVKKWMLSFNENIHLDVTRTQKSGLYKMACCMYVFVVAVVENQG